MRVTPSDILQKYWGFTNFRGSQNDIIQCLLNNQDVLALLPTGGGKSICFQVPALVKEGICIVVSPLVALIQDQVQNLKKKGIKAIGITGGISQNELDSLLDNCIYGNYKFLYLSPERLQQPLVQERIQQMPLNLIAIDEAHCISEWGHDFRPAYLQCSKLRELHDGVPLVALTATATRLVVQDIMDNLDMSDTVIFKDSFRRSNISFHVKNKEDKIFVIKNTLEKHPSSSIVYVRSRKDAVLISRTLNHDNKVADFFHGGLSSFEKKEKLSAWLKNEFQVMVATNAFGMGVDKPDVGTVIHYQMPESMENYYQEAGRAGRDGTPARAILLINPNDIERAKGQFLDALPDLNYIKKVYKKLIAYFQIAYNEGQNQDYFFNLNEFCIHYAFQPTKVYSTLKLLDQNGVLSLSEMSREMNTIHMTGKKDELFAWMDRFEKMGQIVQVLLRTYGGLFEFDTKINLTLLSKKTNQSQKYIHHVLQQLDKDGLAKYNSTQYDIKINFLKPREDHRTINPIAPFVEKLVRSKKKKFKAMMTYASNVSTCRTNLLLAYFGEENKELCGTCDICLSKKSIHQSNRDVKNRIKTLLVSGGKTSREIGHHFNIDEKLLLMSIKELLEDGEIILKPNNTYGIK